MRWGGVGWGGWVCAKTGVARGGDGIYSPWTTGAGAAAALGRAPEEAVARAGGSAGVQTKSSSSDLRSTFGGEVGGVAIGGRSAGCEEEEAHTSQKPHACLLCALTNCCHMLRVRARGAWKGIGAARLSPREDILVQLHCGDVCCTEPVGDELHLSRWGRAGVGRRCDTKRYEAMRRDATRRDAMIGCVFFPPKMRRFSPLKR